MKRVGIITMHKVLNCGSALQAYSLQQFLSRNGYRPEIIDYIYPNSYHKEYTDPRSWFRKLISFVYHYIIVGDTRKMQIAFNKFYKKYFKLSRRYKDRETLHSQPPMYDCYISGSDQVWNPRYIRYDTSFMLSFIHELPKISYSSSFSVNKIPNQYKQIYASCLSSYRHISIREASSQNIIYDLIKRKSTLVVDPTLLIDASDFITISQTSSVNVTRPYILIYILGYAWDPYPFVVDVLNKVYSDLQLPVVILSFNKKYIKDIKAPITKFLPTPENFLALFSNAAFVLTDSYHGTIFSVKFHIPFYSLIQSDLSVDSRIEEFLKTINASDRCINNTFQDYRFNYNMDFSIIDSRLKHIVQDSKDYLLNALSDSLTIAKL